MATLTQEQKLARARSLAGLGETPVREQTMAERFAEGSAEPFAPASPITAPETLEPLPKVVLPRSDGGPLLGFELEEQRALHLLELDESQLVALSFARRIEELEAKLAVYRAELNRAVPGKVW